VQTPEMDSLKVATGMMRILLPQPIRFPRLLSDLHGQLSV
jgi:hypothetical protein